MECPTVSRMNVETRVMKRSKYETAILFSGLQRKYSIFGKSGRMNNSNKGMNIRMLLLNEFHKINDPYPLIVSAPSKTFTNGNAPFTKT